MLELQRVCSGYGGEPVVHNVDLSVQPGEIVALIGANGAGKSTLVKTISGLLRTQSGQIQFEGRRIETLTPRARVLMGIAHVPEGRQTFTGLTVAENLELGGFIRSRPGGSEFTQRAAAVCERFPVLRDRMHEVVANFSGGQHQMLAIARGLMAAPKLLILDEPSLGLSPVLVTEIFCLIASLRDQGMAILLSEQNARLSLAISDRGYVIENGRVVLTGAGVELLNSAEVSQKYLGVGISSATVDKSRDEQFAAKLRLLLQN
jgi:branched-chain amino acid transport system ATP-binding protein